MQDTSKLDTGYIKTGYRIHQNWIHQEAIEDNDKEKPFVSKTSSLYKLNPFIDKMGLLRVGGRLHRSDLPYELKHPAVYHILKNAMLVG